MATLGALWSQQLAFTITATAGEIYTHGLGYTPTVIILQAFGSAVGISIGLFYTLNNTNTITIGSKADTPNNICDVTVGSFHSLIK